MGYLLDQARLLMLGMKPDTGHQIESKINTGTQLDYPAEPHTDKEAGQKTIECEISELSEKSHREDSRWLRPRTVEGPKEWHAEEVARCVEEEGVCIFWSELFSETVAFIKDASCRSKVPASIVAYTSQEVLTLFPHNEKQVDRQTLRLVHEGKKQGGHVISEFLNGDGVPRSALKPATPCHACGSEAWWPAPWGEWVCGVCHPQPAEGEVL